MGVLFEDDARRQLLAKLGFSEAMLPQQSSTTAAAGVCGCLWVSVCLSVVCVPLRSCVEARWLINNVRALFHVECKHLGVCVLRTHDCYVGAP